MSNTRPSKIESMSNKIFALSALAAVMLSLASCMSDDDDATYITYEDTAITSFSLGELRQELHTASKTTGEDSVYYKTVDCSGYAFYIDQKNRVIYNPDSLPCGVDKSRVICNVSSKNGGIILLQSATSVEADSVTFYQSTDSIDFTTPRAFIVYSLSGQNMRRYTVSVNVHRQRADDFAWQRALQSDALAALTDVRGVSMDGALYLFGQGAAGTGVFRIDPSAPGTLHTLATSPALDGGACQNAAALAGRLYTLSGGRVMASADGTEWTEVGAAAIDRIVGASADRLYALRGQQILSSRDGAQWEADAMEGDAALLPTDCHNLTGMPLRTNAQVSQVTLVGTAPDGVRVWGRIEENAAGAVSQPWTLYSEPKTDTRLPAMSHLQVAVYDGAMLATGGSTADGQGPQANFYKSLNGGLNWTVDSTYTLPEEFTRADAPVALCVDAQQYVWLISTATGEAWRGRINRLGWRKEQTDFKE